MYVCTTFQLSSFLHLEISAFPISELWGCVTKSYKRVCQKVLVQVIVCSMQIISCLNSHSKFQMLTLFSGHQVGVPLNGFRIFLLRLDCVTVQAKNIHTINKLQENLKNIHSMAKHFSVEKNNIQINAWKSLDTYTSKGQYNPLHCKFAINFINNRPVVYSHPP